MRLRPRIYLTQLATVVICVLASEFLVRRTLVERAHARVLSALDTQSQLLSAYALELLDEAPAELARKLPERAQECQLRLTLLDAKGQVLADSANQSPEPPNWYARPEIQQALREGVGRSRGIPRNAAVPASVARRLQRGEEIVGFLRMELPGEHELVPDRTVWHWLIPAGIGACAALVLGHLFARSLLRPVTEMTRALEELRAGNWQSRVRLGREDELGVLAAALDRLGEELTRRIADISGDEAQLRAMLAGMVEGVIGVDDEDRVVFSNRAARDLLGIEREVDQGQRIWELIRQPELDGLIQEARNSNVAARCELVLNHDGRERVLGAQAHSFRSAHASGVVVVFDDFTELRRLERIRRDFVANVSHELKTPLTSIRGYVETLLDGALHDTNNNERFLRKVQDNVMRLHHLVTDLLSLARIESQEGQLVLADIDWRALVTQAVRRHDGAARRKGIDLRLEMPVGELRVLGDAESITQVIDNLVDNAIKYTPEGGRITLALGREGEQAVLEVRDTGIGIPHEDLERIFERFYRVDKARSRALGGTGLGLSIVKHLVQAMQGSVAVESEAGRGSTFRVRLALVAARDELAGRKSLDEALDKGMRRSG